jgi:tRNA-Thr(GGU) m(6)t(6)A37 methyltransferase TsaA
MNNSRTRKNEQPHLAITPIGYARTDKKVKYDTPHQPDPEAREENYIELLPHYDFELAVRDLEGFERIWLIWWFNRNKTWKPLVTPPRGEPVKRGVFATRSPHRPAPIGMTVVELLEVSTLRLTVGTLDLLDMTPILDIKPYIPEIDSFPESRDGWVGELEEALKLPPTFIVRESEVAKTQIEWLKSEYGIDFYTRASAQLGRDPTPHRTRRIKGERNGLLFMACGAWRLHFSRPSESEVLVACVTPGYPQRLLHDPDAYNKVPDRLAQIAFSEIWPIFPETGES